MAAINQTVMPKLKYLDLGDNTLVASGGGEHTTTITPPANTIYIVRGIYAYIVDPTGSAANNHRLRLYTYPRSTRSQILNTTANTGSNITWSGYKMEGTSTTPADSVDQIMLMMQGTIRANNSNPLLIIYTNNTDVNQTNTRYLEMLVEEIPERL